MFNSEDYKIYEYEGKVCVTVTHDKPVLFDTFVELIESRDSASSKLCTHCVHILYIYYMCYMNIAVNSVYDLSLVFF